MAENGSGNAEKNSSGDAVPGRVEQIFCQPCSSKDNQTVADVFCSTCDEFQCAECSTVHTKHAFLRNHKLVNATEMKSKPASFDMKGLDQCEQHDEILKFFCEDEKRLCCSTCAIVDHRKCQSVVEVQKIAGKSRSTSSKLKVQLHEVKEKAEILVKTTKCSKQQVVQEVEGVQSTIKRMRDGVMKMFDELEVSVAEDAETFKTETLDKMIKREANSEKHIADATKYLETIDTVVENGTPYQHFIVQQKMEKQVNELYINVEEECKKLETVTVSFDFDEKMTLPPLQISDNVPGQLTLKYSLSDDVKPITPVESIVKLTNLVSIDLKQTGDVERLTLPPSERAKPIVPVDPLVRSKMITTIIPVMPIRLKKVTSIRLKQSGDDVKEPLYKGLDFLPDGRLVAVDNKNSKFLIFNDKLEKVGSYQLSHLPQSVVAISENEVAITSGGNYKIDFLHVSKSSEVTLNRTCEVTLRYDSICLKDERHFVVGTINDTKPVRIVSLSGEEKDFSINFPNKKYPVDTSACKYIRNSDKVVLTDRYEHAVYIYDITTNTRVVVKDDQIKEPRGVAVGPSDCILVCSSRTNSIVQLSPTGRIISSYQLDTIYPYRLCVSQNETILAVTAGSAGKMNLQLFKLAY